MAQRKVKAKYRVVGPKLVKRQITKCYMDDTLSLQQKPEIVEEEMFMVYFPQGHSIRVDKVELVRLGFHKKPRLIDMETGDIVELGGDPYDFMGSSAEEGDVDPRFDVTLQDDDEDEIPVEEKSSKGKQSEKVE